MGAHQVRDDLVGQEFEDPGIAKEACDVDQQVLDKQREFVRVGLQQGDVAIGVAGLDRRHPHPPYDPALQRTRLVEGEIMRRPGAEKRNDFVQPRP